MAATAATLPTVNVTGGHTTANAVTFNNTGKLGNLTVTGTNQRVTVNGPTQVGNVVNSSAGTATTGFVTLLLI